MPVIPFDFVCLLCRSNGIDTIVRDDRHCGPSLHTRDGASLLNFTSGLHSGFRIGLNRHKFATGVARKARPRRLSGEQPGATDTRREGRLAMAARLPKR
jgi:hypothetical protein